MLPLFPVFSLLLASGVRLIPYQGLSEKGQKRLVCAGLVGAVACAGCMVWRGEYGMVALFAVLGALIFSMLKQEFAGALREIPVFTKQLLAVAAALGVLGAGFNAYRPTQQWPAAQQEFKRCVGAMLSERDRLVCWKTSVNVLPYYAKQQVRAFDNEGDLVRYLTALESGHAVYAVLPTRELPPFSDFFKTRLVRSVENKRESEKGLSFVEILGAQEGLLKR